MYRDPIPVLLAAMLLNMGCYVTAVTIPIALDSYSVSATQLELINPNMLDPFDPSTGNRRIMVSSFFPAAPRNECTTDKSSYMPPATAALHDLEYSSYGVPNGTFESFSLDLCAIGGSSSSSCFDAPVLKQPIVVFSPGSGNSRLIYSALAASLASRGFGVVTVDHPHDASIVEFPDGSVVLASNITTDEEIEFSLDVRVKDLTFLATQLMDNRTVLQHLFDGAFGTVATNSLFATGHSLGGATAATVVMQDARYRAGINLDGSFWGNVTEEGLDAPFLLMAHDGKNLTTDPSWKEAWAEFRGPKLLAGVKGSVHASFSDLPDIADVLGLSQYVPAGEYTQLLGAVPGLRMLDVVASSMKMFLKFADGCASFVSFRQGITRFPEIDVLDAVE